MDDVDEGANQPLRKRLNLSSQLSSQHVDPIHRG
jgi:hypothetical protein